MGQIFLLTDGTGHLAGPGTRVAHVCGRYAMMLGSHHMTHSLCHLKKGSQGGSLVSFQCKPGGKVPVVFGSVFSPWQC